MRALSAERALLLPVRLHGIQLGRPVDLLLDAAEWRVLGFDVLCGDEAHRFLAFAAARIGEDEIAAGSALMLLEDIAFYRERARGLRSLLGASVARGGEEAGILRDLLLSRDGNVAELVLEHEGRELRIPPDGVTPALVRAA